MLLLQGVIQRKGIPLTLYSDRHSIFMVSRAQHETLEEQLAGQTPRTQVGRALDELGIRLVLAHSPQAKGRIERLWGTFQDRLLMELRLAGASTLEEASTMRKMAVLLSLPSWGIMSLPHTCPGTLLMMSLSSGGIFRRRLHLSPATAQGRRPALA